MHNDTKRHVRPDRRSHHLDETLGFNNQNLSLEDPAKAAGAVQGWSSFEQQIAWLGVRLLKLATGRWPNQAYGDTPEVLTEVSEAYSGEHPERMRHLCQGYLLMAHGHFKAALHELDAVVQDNASSEVEPFWNLALEAHATCLLHSGHETEAITEYLYLLNEAMGDTRPQSKLDRRAKVFGLARSLATARAAF